MSKRIVPGWQRVGFWHTIANPWVSARQQNFLTEAKQKPKSPICLLERYHYINHVLKLCCTMCNVNFHGWGHFLLVTWEAAIIAGGRIFTFTLKLLTPMDLMYPWSTAFSIACQVSCKNPSICSVISSFQAQGDVEERIITIVHYSKHAPLWRTEKRSAKCLDIDICLFLNWQMRYLDRRACISILIGPFCHRPMDL